MHNDHNLLKLLGSLENLCNHNQTCEGVMTVIGGEKKIGGFFNLKILKSFFHLILIKFRLKHYFIWTNDSMTKIIGLENIP